MFKIFSASPWASSRRPSFEATQPLPASPQPAPAWNRGIRPQAQRAEVLERAWADTCLDDLGAPGAH